MKNLTALILIFLVCLGPALAQSDQVRLAWDANTEADLAGYKAFLRAEKDAFDFNAPFYQGPATQTDPLDVTAWPDGLYYFTARAFDVWGNESEASDEVFCLVRNGVALLPDDVPPAKPGGCRLEKVPRQ